MKSCVQLWNVNGLHSIFLVKTAHKLYPKELLRNTARSRGEWVAATAKVDGHEVMAVRFIDLKEKMFISDVSTSLSGPPRVTKHHGDVARPMVAYEYLDVSAGIDIFNHLQTGSRGLEDVWKTKNPVHRQASGVFGFLTTNAFRTKQFFQKTSLRHYEFKIKLANAMVSFSQTQRRMRRLRIDVVSKSDSDPTAQHLPRLLKANPKDNRYQQPCWYCQHNPNRPPVKTKTSYCCDKCGVDFPLCHPTTDRECFRSHIVYNMPPKRRYVKK